MQLANHDFEHMLDNVMKGTINGAFNPEAAHRMEKESEKEMEEFDREKKIKAARTEEELGKLVITT